ncbi:MAG: HNH endonuclease [Acidobacteria bacterium]|nr:HNH endonuclease [Acidobacteriota bacterium]
MNYSSYLQSGRWEELRTEALKRDGYRCRTCNSADDLEVHHRRYPAAWGTEPVDDLTTLCRECHETITARIQRQIYRIRTPAVDDCRRITPTAEANTVYGLQQLALSDYRRVTPCDAQFPVEQSTGRRFQTDQEHFCQTEED